jgi:ribosomal-protein-serine acetyltransferase
MFSCRVSDRHELHLLQMSDADEHFALINENRAYLRQWLPWLDTLTIGANGRSPLRTLSTNRCS